MENDTSIEKGILQVLVDTIAKEKIFASTSVVITNLKLPYFCVKLFQSLDWTYSVLVYNGEVVVTRYSPRALVELIADDHIAKVASFSLNDPDCIANALDGLREIAKS